MKRGFMNKKNVLLYMLALIAAFVVGCGGAFILRYIDEHEITPLEGGKTIEFADFGLSMSIPEDFRVFDETQASLDAGSDVLYAGRIGQGEDILHLYCYENAIGDDLANHKTQDVVAHYMSAGATQVRMREFGGVPFICYRAEVLTEEGETQIWDSYETWNARVQIVFETQTAPNAILPILATIDFD